MTKQKAFTKEFEVEAVRLARTSGQTRRQTADNLGVGLSTLTRWLSRGRDREIDNPDPPGSEDMVTEVKRLRRENEILRQERDILKKAMVGSTGRCNGIGKGSSRGAKAKSFSRSCIEFERDPVEIVLRVV